MYNWIVVWYYFNKWKIRQTKRISITLGVFISANGCSLSLNNIFWIYAQFSLFVNRYKSRLMLLIQSSPEKGFPWHRARFVYQSKPITIILCCKQPIKLIHLCKQTEPGVTGNLFLGRPVCELLINLAS